MVKLTLSLTTNSESCYQIDNSFLKSCNKGVLMDYEKLLSAILDEDIHDVKDFSEVFEFKIGEFDQSIYRVSKYNLASTAKRRAWEKKRQSLNSFYETNRWFATYAQYYDQTLDGFYAHTEFDAVFKAFCHLFKIS